MVAETMIRMTEKIDVAIESNKGCFLEILEIIAYFIVDKFILA